MEPVLSRAPEHEALPIRDREPRSGAPHAVAWTALALAIAIAGGIVIYLLYWPRSAQTPEPTTAPELSGTPTGNPAATAPEATIRHPIDAEHAQPMPPLEQSDGALRDALARLLGDRPLAALFYPDRMIRRIVATVDNLPRRKAPRSVMPVKQARGVFATAPSAGGITISPDNAQRYAPYVSLARSVDAHALAAVYVRFYPLFQRAYEDLGYPDGYFNDRLVAMIDDLIAAPEIAGPIRLVRPKVFYEFANPELEALSAGQKIMLRIGPGNAAVIKAKLIELRHEVTQGVPRAKQQ